MPTAVSYPPEWPEWVPQPEGLQETRPPYRAVGAEYLVTHHLAETWLAKRPDVDRAAFHTAWIRWLCRDLKAARLRALEASRALKAMRPKTRKTKPRTAGTAGASKLGVSEKCRPNIRTKALRCKPNAAAR